VSLPGLNPDFRDLLLELLAAGVEFAVVGAHALALHGVPRATGDLDILVRPSASNAARLVQALHAFGAPLAVHGVSEADFAHPGGAYQMGLPPRRIDVRTSIDGVTYDDVDRGRRMASIDGLQVPVIGLRELRRNKRAAARPKELLDLALLDEAGVGEDG
jgi:hypothetical protein